MSVEIFPLDKAVIDGVSISLGMDRAAVEAAMGPGHCVKDRCYYHGNELAISFNNGKVEFIEFLGGIDGKLKPAIYGVSAFDSDAEELFALLKQHNNGPIEDQEEGYCYAFRNISVGIYRDTTPDEVEEMIEEASYCGNPMTDEEIAYEMKRAGHWATIGIGVAGYYR